MFLRTRFPLPFAVALGCAALLAPAGRAAQSTIEDPSFSPDGKRIVYTMDGKILLTIGVDGKNVDVLTDAEGARQPRYNFDGSKLVFHRPPPGQANDDIWTINADGSGLTQITATPGFYESHAEFLTDGSIVFARVERPLKPEGKVDFAKNMSTDKTPWFRIYDAGEKVLIPDEIDPFPKKLGLQWIFPLNAEMACVLAGADGRNDEPTAASKKTDVFIMSAGKYRHQYLSPVRLLDSVTTFRRARTVDRYVVTVHHEEIMPVLGQAAPADKVYLLESGKPDVQLDTDRTLLMYDISPDGSKIIAAGFLGKKANPFEESSRLYLYDVATATWSAFPPK